MNTTRIPRTLVVFVLAGGSAALVVTFSGSLVMGLATGLAVWLVAMLLVWSAARGGLLGDPHDASRRRFLVGAGLGGLALVAGGAALGRALAKLARPDAIAAQDAAATRLGAGYMELVRRAYRKGRSAELQLVVAPFNSANYPPESRTLLPKDPRTSHAAPWMYLERSRSSSTVPASSSRATTSRSRHARRPRADHRRAHRVRRLAGRPRRGRCCRA